MPARTRFSGTRGVFCDHPIADADYMTDRQRSTLWLAIGAPVVVIFLAWGAKKYDASKMDVSRFEADSIRRETDRGILLRVDQRVTAMYCARLPIESQAGCR